MAMKNTLREMMNLHIKSCSLIIRLEESGQLCENQEALDSHLTMPFTGVL